MTRGHFAKDLSGQEFGSLFVLRKMPTQHKNGQYTAMWECECKEHKIISIVSTGNLKSGHTQGCKECRAVKTAKAKTKHGKRKHPLYHKLDSMKQRCYLPSCDSYERYGGRGITICDEWLNKETGFMAFYDWCMANEWKPGLTIEREDNNGPYSPENCKFKPMGKQARNRRTTKWVTIKGEGMCLAEAVEKYSSVNYACVLRRLTRGWSDEEAVLRPKE